MGFADILAPCAPKPGAGIGRPMIRLCFTNEAIARIAENGLTQRNPERIRWTDQHAESKHGIGVLLRGKTSNKLTGEHFKILHTQYGAWLEVSNDVECRRVASALCWPALGIEDAVIKVVPEVTHGSE